MVMLVMPRVIWRMCLMTWRMKMVSRLLENPRSTTAVTKSRKVETWTLILNLLASVFADKTIRVRENVQASTFLWMMLTFKLTLWKSFPTSPHSLHFAFGVKSSHLPSWITSWSKPTCMHTATAIFLLFRLAEKIFRPSLASFCCRAIIIFPKCEDFGIPIVSKAMSRASFRHIKRRIHFADNHNLEQGKKIAKVAPVYTSVNTTLAKFGVFHEDLSIDESIVPYFGRHSAKMFIRGKPIRFGYKLWSLCGSDGYPYHLQVYKGKEATSSNEPLGTRVVNHIVEVVRENSDAAKHHFFFDNFFTSHKLLSDLASEKGKATGTVRENRIGGANRDLTSTKEMKKSTRGTFDFRCDGTVFMCKWNDNSVVTVASNCQTHTPVHEVRRRVKGQPVNNVQQPHLIHAYNQGMGGVDLMDRMLASHRPSIRGKKWYWPLLNVTFVVAWRIHCKIAESPLSHLDFRREIAICLLEMSVVSRLQVGGGPRVNLPDDVRFDEEDHEKVAASQGRCKVCKKIAVTCVQSATCGCTMSPPHFLSCTCYS